MEIVKQWKTPRKVSSLTFNSDSSLLYVAGNDLNILLFSVYLTWYRIFVF